jgi:hypothetical protein
MSFATMQNVPGKCSLQRLPILRCGQPPGVAVLAAAKSLRIVGMSRALGLCFNSTVLKRLARSSLMGASVTLQSPARGYLGARFRPFGSSCQHGGQRPGRTASAAGIRQAWVSGAGARSGLFGRSSGPQRGQNGANTQEIPYEIGTKRHPSGDLRTSGDDGCPSSKPLALAE